MILSGPPLLFLQGSPRGPRRPTFRVHWGPLSETIEAHIGFYLGLPPSRGPFGAPPSEVGPPALSPAAPSPLHGPTLTHRSILTSYPTSMCSHTPSHPTILSSILPSYPVPTSHNTPFLPTIILCFNAPSYPVPPYPHITPQSTIILRLNLPSCPVFSYSYTPCQRQLVGQLVGRDEISFSDRILGIWPCALLRSPD